MVQKKGATPLSDVQKVPQAPSLRSWCFFTKVSGKNVVYTLPAFSQLHGYTVGAKEVGKKFKNFLLFIPILGTICFDFSQALM